MRNQTAATWFNPYSDQIKIISIIEGPRLHKIREIIRIAALWSQVAYRRGEARIMDSIPPAIVFASRNPTPPVIAFDSGKVIQGVMAGPFRVKGRCLPFQFLVLAFRGSDTSILRPVKSFLDWRTNFQTALRTYGSGSTSGYGGIKGRIHGGFGSVFREEMIGLSSMHSLLQGLAGRAVRCASDGTAGEPIKVIVTGHSLGGALALLGASYMQSILPRSRGISFPVYGVTFGAPRVGNRGFVDGITRVIPANRLFRVVHGNDPVPVLPIPLPFGYRHAGTKIKVGGRRTFPLSLADHGMKKYAEAVFKDDFLLTSPF